MKDINLLSIDLEMNQPSGKIIQVGICVGNLKSGEILHKYSKHIKLDYEVLAERIIKLTGIKQQDVDNGITLEEGYEDLKTIHKEYTCFRNPITWGSGDTVCLKNQLKIPDDEMFLFGRRWIDVKTLYICYRWANDLSHQAGLAKALLKMGLQFKGRKHDGLDDAINTFIIYRELLLRYKGD